MTYRLYDFPASPFCIKIRALLDYKGVPYERINTVGPAMIELRRRGGVGKVPALEMDGKLLCDSTDIAYAIEARHPSPAVVPTEPRQRALCHVLEDWADESLYWFGVYYRWVDAEGRAGAPSVFQKSVLGQYILPRLVGRAAARQLHGQGLGRKPAKQVLRDLERQLDHLEALLSPAPFLLGDAPMLCDFAICGQLVYLVRTPQGGRLIAQRENVFSFMDRMRALRAARDGADAGASR